MSLYKAKIQISLGIRPVWSESVVTKDPNFLRADSKDSNQTEMMPSLIRPHGHKTSFMLISTKQQISTALKIKIKAEQ